MTKYLKPKAKGVVRAGTCLLMRFLFAHELLCKHSEHVTSLTWGLRPDWKDIGNGAVSGYCSDTEAFSPRPDHVMYCSRLGLLLKTLDFV